MYWVVTLYLSQAADPATSLLTSNNPLLVAIGVVFASLMTVDKLAFWMVKRRNGNGNGNTADAKRIADSLDGLQAQLHELNTNMSLVLDRIKR